MHPKRLKNSPTPRKRKIYTIMTSNVDVVAMEILEA